LYVAEESLTTADPDGQIDNPGMRNGNEELYNRKGKLV